MDGTLEDTATWSGSLDNGVASYMTMGGTTSNGENEYWHGYISNYRLVRGHDIYEDELFENYEDGVQVVQL